MSHENFIRLVNDFCDVTGLDKPMRVVHGGPISINRVIFSLIQKDNDLQRFFIYSDFGAFPKNSTTIAYQALLAQNLFLYPDNGPVFAVSPETGRALCISHYLVSEMNAQKLSQTFT
ncbi:MAG: CesT family type III secretion system chaperone, partial [Exilibacterium sp.]